MVPGDEDVAWFGDDHSVLALGKRVQQQREALQSLKRDVGEKHFYSREVFLLMRGILIGERCFDWWSKEEHR